MVYGLFANIVIQDYNGKNMHSVIMKTAIFVLNCRKRDHRRESTIDFEYFFSSSYKKGNKT